MRAGDQPGRATNLPDSDLVIVKPDPSDNPKQAAEKLVWSFLVLFENLVSARTLLKSVQEATLLVTPAPGQPALAKGSETTTAEAFVKKLQVSSMGAVRLWCYAFMRFALLQGTAFCHLFGMDDVQISRVDVCCYRGGQPTFTCLLCCG